MDASEANRDGSALGITPATDREILARVATLYYIDDRTQEEIARALGISRVKVGRLLRKARAEGVVEIRIHREPGGDPGVELTLARRYKLRQAILTPTAEDPERDRARTGAAAAACVSRLLRRNQTIAVGMGRNVASVADAMSERPGGDTTVVSGIGGSPLIGSRINSNDICRRFAARLGGTGIELYAPAFAESPTIRDSFLSHDDVKATLARARRADIAVVGIGDAESDSAVVRIGCVPPQDMERLRNARAVGDILGNFFNRDGRMVDEGVRDRVIGLSEHDLRAIPCVVGIASEAGKAVAVRAALRTGIVDILVAPLALGREILAEDDADERPEPTE